jgi:predicted dehydrogenase
VAAVASRDKNRALEFAQSNGIERACTYDELLADDAVDVVYITLPPSLHADWSIRAMQAGKHVLCEKPLASNAEEAAAIDDVARETGRIFVEGYHYHHHPLARRLRDLVNAEAIGRVESVDAQFHIPSFVVTPGNIRLRSDLGGGAMMDAGCYCIHALRHLLGDPVEVTAADATVSEDDRAVDLGMRATLAFPGSVEAIVNASFLAKETADVVLTVRGARGELVVRSLFVPQWGGTLSGRWDERTFAEPVDQTPTYEFQLRELVRSVRDDIPVLTTAADGVHTMAVIDDVYRVAGLQPRRGSLA